MNQINTGDCAFIIMCTLLIFLMTPGLALFYGGMVRRKNVINTMFSVFIMCGLGIVLWVAVGYSLSFGSDIFGIVGGFNHLFFNGVSAEPNALYAPTIPETLFAIFQMMFAVITPAIIAGSLSGRIKLSAMVAFMTLWSILVYYPLVHIVWSVDGFLRNLGALDFAGGTVIHISSGVSGLVACILLGKRRGYPIISYKPHNIPFILIGGALLWIGWFAFNGGCSLGIGTVAINVLTTTAVASAMGMLSWSLIEKIKYGKPTLFGAVTGSVIGLVAITPAAGFVTVGASFIIGALGSPICFFCIDVVRKKFGYDDALDAFGCHGVGGIWGCLATGIFASNSANSAVTINGLVYSGNFKLVLIQLESMVFVIIFVIIMTFIIFKFIGLFTKVRASEAEEANGLDVSEHNESAYPSFLGLD